MVRYKYGKKFRKNGKLVQYKYPNGKKRGKKLVTVKSRRSSSYRSSGYRRRRY